MKTLEQILWVIETNRKLGKHIYAGLSSAEIGVYSRFQMFGEDDEAFPSEEEWSSIVD